MCQKVRESLTTAVEKRLMADVPFGVLLSGGLDSSSVCSTINYVRENTDNTNQRLTNV